MKIALFTEIYDCGGVDTFISGLVRNWPDPADEFVVIANASYPGLGVVEEKLAGRPVLVERHRLRTYPDMLSSLSEGGRALCRIFSPLTRYFYLAYDVFALRGLLFKHKPDALIVINGGYPGGDSCRAATICWGLFGAGSRGLHTVHSLAVRPRPWVFLQEALVDFLVSACAWGIVAVSKAAAEALKARPAIRASKVGYIHNGAEPFGEKSPGPDIRAELGLPADTRLCLMLGTYDSFKGHDFLLDAFKLVLEKVPSARLIVCGHGAPADMARVAGLAAARGLEKAVLLLGYRPDAMSFLSQADVLLVSSQAFESFGFTSVEAMLQGVPVVATAVGGIPEVVEDGEGGYCLEKNDVNGYAERVIALLADEKLRAEQGRKGAERAARFFTAKVMAEKYYNYMRGALRP